jgi:hypothetical protein
LRRVEATRSLKHSKVKRGKSVSPRQSHRHRPGGSVSRISTAVTNPAIRRTIPTTTAISAFLTRVPRSRFYLRSGRGRGPFRTGYSAHPALPPPRHSVRELNTRAQAALCQLPDSRATRRTWCLGFPRPRGLTSSCAVPRSGAGRCTSRRYRCTRRQSPTRWRRISSIPETTKSGAYLSVSR